MEQLPTININKTVLKTETVVWIPKQEVQKKKKSQKSSWQYISFLSQGRYDYTERKGKKKTYFYTITQTVNNLFCNCQNWHVYFKILNCSNFCSITSIPVLILFPDQGISFPQNSGNRIILYAISHFWFNKGHFIFFGTSVYTVWTLTIKMCSCTSGNGYVFAPLFSPQP